jgi:hypothetical protein
MIETWSLGDGFGCLKGYGVTITMMNFWLAVKMVWLLSVHGIHPWIKAHHAKVGRTCKQPPKPCIVYSLHIPRSEFSSVQKNKHSQPPQPEKSKTTDKSWAAKSLRPVNEFSSCKWLLGEKGRKLVARFVGSDIQIVEVLSVEEEPYKGFVYDLGVDSTEAFFGGEVPVLLHNTRKEIEEAKKAMIDEFRGGWLFLTPGLVQTSLYDFLPPPRPEGIPEPIRETKALTTVDGKPCYFIYPKADRPRALSRLKEIISALPIEVRKAAEELTIEDIVWGISSKPLREVKEPEGVLKERLLIIWRDRIQYDSEIGERVEWEGWQEDLEKAKKGLRIE